MGFTVAVVMHKQNPLNYDSANKAGNYFLQRQNTLNQTGFPAFPETPK